ncbi:hypothetical protein PMV44_01785 [Enterococcus casseliflavus]|uniref:hypothetical protein n=1 Tax=Enterococcus casseliflavus TaxID=37734 RepID=UPI002330F417|nr:hypothetical protein [Enterococcus casseliflavus]MDB1690576.1 hypothetical protein [Enterococcus casseliflavus]
MFTSEDGAYPMISRAVDKYEAHFDSVFPLYEYISITAGNGYDFSIKGAIKFEAFIDDRIKSNEPVEIPEGYEERLY